LGCGEFYRKNKDRQTLDFRPSQNPLGDWLIVCKGKSDLSAVTLATGVEKPGGGYYEPLWIVSFQQAPVAAGPRGENLSPGQCAFPDRPIGAPQIRTIRLEKLCNPTVTQRVVSIPPAHPAAAYYGVGIVVNPLLSFGANGQVFGIYIRQEGDVFSAIIDRTKGSVVWEL
jgi:hypothetical protein